MATAEALISLLEGFTSAPQETRQVLRDWLEVDLPGFLESAKAYASDFQPVSGSRFLFHLLAARGLLDDLIWEANRSAGPTLPELLRVVKAVDPDLTLRTTQGMVARVERDPEGSASDLKLLMRMLAVAGPDPRLLPALSRLTNASDRHVASKAALLAGKLIYSGDWFIDKLMDADQRVRANAVEALWGLDHEVAVDIFRRATHDPAPRSAANAWYGLYAAGHVDSLIGLARMAARDDPDQQASAAWAMGQTGDSRFLAILRGLLGSPHRPVVKNALAALRAISRKGPPAEGRQAPARLWSDEREGSSAVWSVLLPAAAKPRAIDWRLEGAAGMILETEASYRGVERDLDIALALPSAPEVSAADWLEIKRPADLWGRILYDPAIVSPRVYWSGKILNVDAAPQPQKNEEATPPTVLLARDIRSWRQAGPCVHTPLALPAALAACLQALTHARGDRHLVTVAAPGVDAEFAEDLEALLASAQAYRIHLHFLAQRNVPQRLAACYRTLAAETKGWFRRGERLDEHLSALLQALGGVWRVHIDAGRHPGPWKLSLPDSAAPLHIPATAVDWEA